MGVAVNFRLKATETRFVKTDIFSCQRDKQPEVVFFSWHAAREDWQSDYNHFGNLKFFQQFLSDALG